MPHGFSDHAHEYVCVNDKNFEKLCFGEIEGIRAVLKASCSILLKHICALIAYECGSGMHIL